MAAGVPNIRYIPASRVLPGPADVAEWIEPMLNELVRPLTDKEKEAGMYNPRHDRFLFEGTLMEAEEFYQQTRFVPGSLNAPISVYHRWAADSNSHRRTGQTDADRDQSQTR